MRVNSGTYGSQLAGEALAVTTDFLRVQGRFASKLAPTENKAEISKSQAKKSPA
jgi:hypothetical protein